MEPKYSTGKISIVIPVYRSKQSLPILIERLVRQLCEMGREYEIVLIDDCSQDETWSILGQLKNTYPQLKIARLLRNSGQHNAILCGFTLVTGDIIVTMDDDLQNPPEEIPKLVAAIDSGYDLAIGAYDSKKHTWSRNLGGEFVDNLQRRIFGLPRDFQLTSFRAVRRIVIDNVIKMAGSFPYITSMLLSHTSRYTNVPVHHESREFGRSNYNLRRSASLALNLILSYSSYPLYLVVALCTAAFIFAGGFSLIVLTRILLHGAAVPGWASTILITSFFNALILLALVILGIYISRLNQQISRTRVGFTIGELHE